MTDRHLERAIEWEAASQPIVLEHLSFPAPEFMPGTATVTIARDDDLRLQLVGEGVLTETGAYKRRREEDDGILPGGFYPENNVSFDAYGSKLALRMHMEYVPSDLHTSRQVSRFQQHGSVYGLSRTWSQRFAFEGEAEPRIEPLGEPAWLSDWYVNGSTSMRFTRRTTRKRTAGYSRGREFRSVSFSESPGGGDAWDHLVVDAGDVRFALCKVPEEEAPKELGAMSIEFLAPFPNNETRTAIAEIVSFALGRRMMRVGSTTYDASGWSIEEEAVNPWGTNVRKLCRGQGLPPVEFHSDGRALEALLVLLVPRYLTAREPLGLQDALWSYWIAKESPAAIDLPIFSSAVEALKRRWLASTQSKSRGLHLTKDDFQRLTRDLVEELQKRVQEQKLPGELVRNFVGANCMGLGEQVRVFLKEIDIPIGVPERSAMDARHKYAHGVGGGEQLVQLVRLGNAYRTLFERVFLRLLRYNGNYVDRTTEGWPERPLGEPAGGRSGEPASTV